MSLEQKEIDFLKGKLHDFEIKGKICYGYVEGDIHSSGVSAYNHVSNAFWVDLT